MVVHILFWDTKNVNTKKGSELYIPGQDCLYQLRSSGFTFWHKSVNKQMETDQNFVFQDRIDVASSLSFVIPSLTCPVSVRVVVDAFSSSLLIVRTTSTFSRTASNVPSIIILTDTPCMYSLLRIRIKNSFLIDSHYKTIFNPVRSAWCSHTVRKLQHRRVSPG